MGGLSSGEFLAAFAVAAAAGTMVFFHAERNQIRHPSAWASAVFLFLAVGLPFYLLHVRRVRRRREQPPPA
jgi:Flp pilus assembly protein TadB